MLSNDCIWTYVDWYLDSKHDSLKVIEDHMSFAALVVMHVLYFKLL